MRPCIVAPPAGAKRLLFVTYGACFGIEIFIHNIAAVYYVEHFGLSLGAAGLAAGSFGLDIGQVSKTAASNGVSFTSFH